MPLSTVSATKPRPAPGAGPSQPTCYALDPAVQRVMTMPNMLLVIFSLMDPKDVAYWMTMQAHRAGTGAKPTFHGGIRSVSKSFKFAFDNYAPKIINMETYQAYNIGSVNLIRNIVSLYLFARGEEHVSQNKYFRFLQAIAAVQVLGLKTLTVDPYSSYQCVMGSNFVAKVLPALNLQLDVFSSGFTCLSEGHFLSMQEVYKSAFSAVPLAEVGTGERAMMTLISKSNTLELSQCYSPFQTFCAMKLASSAKILRFVRSVEGTGFVEKLEKDAIIEAFFENNNNKEPKVFANFERLEIKNHDMQTRNNMDLFRLLSGEGLLLNHLQVLPNVTEVSIEGMLSRSIIEPLMLPNVQRVEFTNVPAFTNKLELTGESGKPAPMLAVSIDTGHDLCLTLNSSFPNARFVRVSLQDRFGMMRSSTGRASVFLGVILGRLLGMTEQKEGGLVLELCQGVVALTGLDLSAENSQCFDLGPFWSSDRDCRIQLVPTGPCCREGKVVCRFPLPGKDAECPGKLVDLHLRCRNCSEEQRSPGESWVDVKKTGRSV